MEDENCIGAAFDIGEGPSTSGFQSTSGEQKREETASYAVQASFMRSQIEEKITEIENKMNAFLVGASSESIDSNPSVTDCNLIPVQDVNQSLGCSLTEKRQSTIHRLQSKLDKHLELKKLEIGRLRQIREEFGTEIENLTASYSEEAKSMVRNAEKEAMMKLRMIQNEMQKLKFLVRSERTPVPVNNYIKPTARRIVIGGKVKHDQDDHEVDPIFHKEFKTWKEDPKLCKTSPFLKRIFEEDINPCLEFKNKELAALVLLAIENNLLGIEKIEDSKRTTETCALLLAPRLCTYQLCINTDKFNVCSFSCNRVAAAMELLGYIRFLHQGYLNFRLHRTYLEILKRRRQINAATLGFTYYLD